MYLKVWITKFPTHFTQIRLKSTTTRPVSKLKNLLTEMPKEPKHLAEVRQQRIKIKERSAKYVPGTVILQVLGSGAPGAPASVYLFSDNYRYLFNCGEGTQRLANEHKIKLTRLEHIFMTRTSWERIGGLPGLSLTIQDSGVPRITLHGPPGLDEIFRAMRRFVVLRDLKVESIECRDGEFYDDDVLNVQYVPIKRKVQQDENMVTEEVNSEVPEVDDTDYYGHEEPNARPVTPPTPPNVDKTRRQEDVVTSYICRLKPKQGTLLLEKCVDKGVPPGPLLGQLKNGIDVTLPNGTVVRAQDVTSPVDPGPVFIFVDVPSLEYIESFQSTFDIFSKHGCAAANESDVAVVVLHFTPESVINTQVYQQFIDKFPPSTKHLVLNGTNKFSGYVAAHRIQWNLNQMSDSIFPILKEEVNNGQNSYINEHKRLKTTPEKEEQVDQVARKLEENAQINGSNQKPNCLDYTNSLTYYHLRPRKGLDRSNEPIVSPSEYLQETNAVEGFTESLTNLRKELSKGYKELGENVNYEYPQVIFFGTGSCIPNKTRNVSSIMLRTSEDSSIMLDCGEGTVGQLVRFYGVEEAKHVLRSLKAVYISHLHADHHIGLIGILKARAELGEKEAEPLILLAPKQILPWLYFYDHRIEQISETYNLEPINDLITDPLQSTELQKLGIKSISTCLVPHCPHSFGVSMLLDKNESNSDMPIKITYSGDTLPCDELVSLGKNSTILIHEATMEDDLLSEAKVKKHCTVTQAIEIGCKMDAKYTLLTHFSQRYAKIPRIENDLQNNVGIAFDNMRVTLKDLGFLNKLYPTLKLMFSEHCEELEQKSLKRAFKKERRQQTINETAVNR